MARPTPLSGFPEWLPADRIVEQRLTDTIRHTFELHGFAGIETRAVEPVNELLHSGETSKEVYLLRRLQAENESGDKQLGLHFDLTVPFARYVVENAGKLLFPFKRYQIQKVWRGERPQEGRFREFTQADIDVVGQGELPYHYEIDLPLVMADALAACDVGPFTISVNNRKVSEGFFRGVGIENVVEALRALDKLGKIGPEATGELLAQTAGATPAQAAACLELAEVRAGAGEIADRIESLANRHGADSPLLQAGTGELVELMGAADESAPGVFQADLSIARGLDYYTGSVYETTLAQHPKLGSICSGGRYDTLATDGSTTYPGVGLSIGVSRLVSGLIGRGAIVASRSVPSAVLVAVNTPESRGQSDRIARQLRARDIPVEVAPSAAKYGKQIKYADRRGIPFVYFPAPDAESVDQIKDIRSGEQTPIDPASWCPPTEDWWPSLIRPGLAT